MKTENSVQDGKLTNEQLGGLTRRNNEIIRRINDGTLSYDDAMKLLQGFIIEARPSYLGVLKGTHEIKMVKHCIDCDAGPFVPDGWKVEEHQKMGNIKFDPSKIDFYLSQKQKNGRIEGNKLREELKGKKVLNANVLDYLLKNPQIIPEEWKKDEKGNTRFIFFWGTIYRDSYGGLCVRYLYWFVVRWDWGHNWLGIDFSDHNLSAVLAS
jgi:hypothetical protein